MKDALKFRLKLFLAMMLVVAAVTSALSLIAERNLRLKNHEELEAKFHNEVEKYLATTDARFAAIREKSRQLSRSVRLRAAMEERDADDLYRNALTELRSVLVVTEEPNQSETTVFKADFVRFIDRAGNIIPPPDAKVGETELPLLAHALESTGRVLGEDNYQMSGFIRIAPESGLDSLRQIVATKIVDWNGYDLGALVLGFPVVTLQPPQTDSNKFLTGLFFSGHIYIETITPADRTQIRTRLETSIQKAPSASFEVSLESGPHRLFYKNLDPETKLQPAYEVCLFPLTESLQQAHMLRWKIAVFGVGIFVLGIILSLVMARRLAKPVDHIVAGSEENFARRQEAEENLVATNRELEKTLAELRATQRQVIQQERLSALGQMASGIAHDFNNSLTPILGFSELLLKNETALRDPIKARKFLELLHTSAKDAASVVNRLREFYRPLESNEEFPPVDLARIVQQAISLTAPKWKNQAQASGVHIEVSAVDHGSPVIAGEEAALREVLTNLIFNAVDAMPAGGHITLRTSIENGSAILRVEDSGTGMSEEVRLRCLEPFYSTKGERGTGLGLSMVYGIIERHRGHLEIESALGRGTSFVIRLPLLEQTKVAQTVNALREVVHRNLKILVVDDDERVCTIMGEYLREDGHRVVLAKDGASAIAFVKDRKFDLAFVDRAMPGLSGDQTASLLKKFSPELPIILLTGFGTLIEVTGEQPQCFDAVIGKPVTLNTLRQTIDQFQYAA